MIHHSTRGRFALRSGDWYYLDDSDPPASEPEWYRTRLNVQPFSAPGQLYNLKDDPTQSTNLFSAHPEKADELKRQLQQAIGDFK